MPASQKTSWAKLRVGLMTLAALVILAIAVFLITGQTPLFESEATLYTFLSDAASLTAGVPVNLNGVPIGKVTEIRLSGLNDPQKIVKITMQVQKDKLKEIPVDSLTSISAANVLGTKFINIKKGKATQAAQDHDTLPSLNTAEFEDVVQQGYAILTVLQDTVARINTIVGSIENGQGSIGKLLRDETLYNRLLEIVASVKELADALNSDKGTLGKLIYSTELYDDVRSTIGRVNTIVDDLQAGQGTAGKLLKDPALYDKLNQNLDQIHSLLADLNAGKGTAGKLLKTDELHKQLQESIAKIDLTIDKINSGQGTIGQLLVNPQLDRK